MGADVAKKHVFQQGEGSVPFYHRNKMQKLWFGQWKKLFGQDKVKDKKTSVLRSNSYHSLKLVSNLCLSSYSSALDGKETSFHHQFLSASLNHDQ